MKILSIAQTREADRRTIESEPISSIDLMERAAAALLGWFKSEISRERPVNILCGKGNNGGDGLALARLLNLEGYQTNVYYWQKEGSEDFQINWNRLPLEIPKLPLDQIGKVSGLDNAIWVDALFGSGLNRSLGPEWRETADLYQSFNGTKIAIDLPSGLIGDDPNLEPHQIIFQADYCLSFQYPKYVMVHPYTAHWCGQPVVLDIGLDSTFLQEAQSQHFWLEAESVQSLLQPRAKYSYKNQFGHAWALAGSPETMGAALLSCEAALRCGLGLMSLNVAKESFAAFNARLPELMLEDRQQSLSLKAYNAVLVGPGLGQKSREKDLLKQVIKDFKGPKVLDADAINLLAVHPNWFQYLQGPSLLTPHPGELKRLLGLEQLGPDQLDLAQSFASKNGLYILIKGSISVLICPDGNQYFFDFGSPALAKGGSGDLLAGAITAFLAQGYSMIQAVSLGMYIQGGAAKRASKRVGSDAAVLTSDIIGEIGGLLP